MKKLLFVVIFSFFAGTVFAADSTDHKCTVVPNPDGIKDSRVIESSLGDFYITVHDDLIIMIVEGEKSLVASYGGDLEGIVWNIHYFKFENEMYSDFFGKKNYSRGDVIDIITTYFDDIRRCI